MKINRIRLENFRNHTELDLLFEDNTTVLIGENGSGKTNVLESINLLSICKSSRSLYDTDLINHSKNYTSILGNVYIQEEDYIIEIFIQKQHENSRKSTKKTKINKVPKPIYKFTGLFNSVLFTPEDIQLLTRSPSIRRKYIDNLLSQVDRKYKKDISDYSKAVRQRNKLLEDYEISHNIGQQMTYWTNIALNTGTYIQSKRTALFNALQQSMQNNMDLLQIAKNEITINYKENQINETRLKEYENKERYARTTLIGPHRDDFEIYTDGFDIANFGSRGQQRGIVLALKLAEIDYIENEKSERPVLLLDDIFSELDLNHRKAVLKILDQQQNIITSAEKHDFLSPFSVHIL